MVVTTGSREVKEDLEARNMERGKKDGRKEGGVKVQEREQLVLRRLCCQWWGNNVVLCMGVVVIEVWWVMVGKTWWCGVYVVTAAAVLKEGDGKEAKGR